MMTWLLRVLDKPPVWLDEGMLRKALVVGRLRFEISRSAYSHIYTISLSWKG